MYAAQKKCWNQRKLPRHSLIIISSFTAVDLDYTANLMPMIPKPMTMRSQYHQDVWSIHLLACAGV